MTFSRSLCHVAEFCVCRCAVAIKWISYPLQWLQLLQTGCAWYMGRSSVPCPTLHCHRFLLPHFVVSCSSRRARQKLPRQCLVLGRGVDVPTKTLFPSSLPQF